jgi:hypothetical protein
MDFVSPSPSPAPEASPAPLPAAQGYVNDVSSIKVALVRGAAPLCPGAQGFGGLPGPYAPQWRARAHIERSGGARPLAAAHACSCAGVPAPVVHRRPPPPPPLPPGTQTINAVIGSACLMGFLIFRSFMHHYQLRSVLPYVTIRPPPLPTGFKRVYGWIKPGAQGEGRSRLGAAAVPWLDAADLHRRSSLLPGIWQAPAPGRARRAPSALNIRPAFLVTPPHAVFMASDVWLLHSAGLDALVLQKSIALLVQLFLPMVIFGCGLREWRRQHRTGSMVASHLANCVADGLRFHRMLDNAAPCPASSDAPADP